MPPAFAGFPASISAEPRAHPLSVMPLLFPRDIDPPLYSQNFFSDKFTA